MNKNKQREAELDLKSGQKVIADQLKNYYLLRNIVIVDIVLIIIIVITFMIGIRFDSLIYAFVSVLGIIAIICTTLLDRNSTLSLIVDNNYYRIENGHEDIYNIADLKFIKTGKKYIIKGTNFEDLSRGKQSMEVINNYILTNKDKN